MRFACGVGGTVGGCGVGGMGGGCGVGGMGGGCSWCCSIECGACTSCDASRGDHFDRARPCGFIRRHVPPVYTACIILHPAPQLSPASTKGHTKRR